MVRERGTVKKLPWFVEAPCIEAVLATEDLEHEVLFAAGSATQTFEATIA